MAGTDGGYGVVGLEGLPWTRHGDGAAWASLTGALGATETAVDAVRLGRGGAVTLAAADEQLLIPLDGQVAIDGPDDALRHPGLARVPAGVEGGLRADAAATLLVVSAAAEPAESEPPVVLDLDALEYEVPSTSTITTAFLTGPLGLAGMKANARRLEPGQHVPAHTEGDQEELFVPLRGPAALGIEGEAHAMGVGDVGRVAPPVPRSASNPGEEPALWVMVGAPPTGEDDWWDPGAEILE